MISKTIEGLEYTSINDEEGLTGIICPDCGRRIPLLEIFGFDAKKGVNRDGIPLFADHVDLVEEYECDCGASFKVYLDCKYAIGPATPAKQSPKFQEETIIPLYVDSYQEPVKINLPEK